MKNYMSKVLVGAVVFLLIFVYLYKFNSLSTLSTDRPQIANVTQLVYNGSNLLNEFNQTTIDNYPTAAGTYDLATMASQITSQLTQAFSNAVGKPLPLVANWNVGIPEYSDGLDPMYMINRLANGEHIVPTWKLDAYFNDTIGLSYYEASIKKAAELGLPLVFILPSPESALTHDDVYFSMDKTNNPNVITTNGTVLPKLSPFGPNNLWNEVGEQWSTTSLMAQLQEWYPNPPLVLFIDTDSSKKLSWSELSTSSRYTSQYPTDATDEFKRTLVNAKWIEKYRQLHQGFKNSFVSESWKHNAKFISRNQLALNMGTTSDWQKSATTTNLYANIWPLTADGLTIDFNLDGDRTDTTNAPHTLLNNLPFMLDQAKVLDSNFTYQLSINANQKIDNPQRYRGFTQFALWFLRPSIIRETSSKSTKDEINPLFQQVVDSVELVNGSDILADFWKNGKLVKTGDSNYNLNIPTEYQSVPREFLLKTDATSTVWAFALEKGVTPDREWLIYVQSPERNISKINVDIPLYQNILLESKPEGSLYVLYESDQGLKHLNNTNIKYSTIGKREINSTNLSSATMFATPNGQGIGTIDDPYSLEMAIKNLKPGDILFLRGGTYNIPKSKGIRINYKIGTKEKPIIIESYPGEIAILDGKCTNIMDAVNGVIDTSYGLYLRESNYIYIRKLEIKRMSRTGIKIIGKHNKIEGCKIHNNFLPGISIENRNGYSVPYVDGWNIIIDNEIYNNSDAGYDAGKTWKDGDNADGISVSSSTNNIITHNTIYSNADDGIDTWKSNYTKITYNLVYDNGRGSKGTGNGIKMGGNSNPDDPNYTLNGIGATAYHNISFNNKALGFHQNRGKFLELKYNTAYNNKGTGFSFTPDTNLSYNISFKNKINDTYPFAKTRINNSWNIQSALNSSNFISLDQNNTYFLVPTQDSNISDIGAYANENE